MDLTIDGYLHSLVKHGNPPQHELLKTEGNLRVQYADAIGDAEYRMYCGLIKEITELEIKLKQVESLVDTLRDIYNPVLVKLLNGLLYTSFEFNVTNPEEYDKNLDRCLKRSRSIKINIDLKNMAVNKMEEKYSGNNGKKPSREYYMGYLITLSNDAGYGLSDNMTVWEFCERIKRYNKKVEMINSKGYGRGRN